MMPICLGDDLQGDDLKKLEVHFDVHKPKNHR